MVLCDIGNRYFHFYRHGRVWKERVGKIEQLDPLEQVYYISVNPNGTKKLLNQVASALNLAPYFRLDTQYRGLGIDRAAACLAVNDGLIVDAGSAITVDIMQSGMHLGGYILPGIATFLESYSSISPSLKSGINFAINFAALPQNTQDAISYGVLKSILLMIKDSSKAKSVYFTGGDGKFLSKFFESSIYDESLIFKGMMRVIEEGKRR